MGASIFFTAAMIRAFCAHQIYPVAKKKNFSSFPVAVNNSITVGPLGFLL
jgi:hypothetical protein